MKKILLVLFLTYLALATCASCGGCGGGCTPPPPSGLPCGPCACPNQGSFNVNNQVCVQTPGKIPSPCPVPVIPIPHVCPPDVDIPEICPTHPKVCPLKVPQVVAPPTICPPTPCLPTIQPPHIPIPSLPPQIPLPTTPVIPPPRPTYTPPTYVGPPCASLSSTFTFSFSWACRQGVSFLSCEANILWNNVIIASIVPTDYEIHFFKVNVTVVAGKNSLQIEGAGYADSYGLTVDEVKLVRVGSAQNIVINGGFQNPAQFGGWHIYNNIPGWTALGIEIGWGDIYNHRWNSQVAELDGSTNYQMSQYFTFDSDFELVPNAPQYSPFNGQTLAYTLEFRYAARSVGTSSPFTSQADVLWNDVVIDSLVPGDYLVKTFSKTVQLKAGVNSLAFDGAGVSDGYGLIIDNVKLYSAYDATNLIVNGDFSAPVLAANTYNYYNGGISGWWAAKAEVGDCDAIYNGNWPASFGQCIELDTDANQRYLQTITITQAQFSDLFVLIKNQQGVGVAQSNLATALATAQYNLNSAVCRIYDNIYAQISFTQSQAASYLQQLYGYTNVTFQNLKDDAALAFYQYDILSEAYGEAFGCTSGSTFDLDYFLNKPLINWHGVIKSIVGDVICCLDEYGNLKYFVISKCTHFEGNWPMPLIGQKIIVKGALNKCGKVYAKIISVCNCKVR